MADIKIRFGINEENGKPIEVDKRYIESISSLSQSTSNASSIEYGSLENSGDVVIYDRNNYIKNLIEDEIIQTEGTPITIIANGKELQRHISSDNTYDANSKQFSMSLTNRMKDWSILKYKGFPYPNQPLRAYELLYDVLYRLHGSSWSDSSIFDEMVSDSIIWGENNYKTSIKDYLKNVIIEYPVIEYGRTYRDVIDEFCNMLQLQVYINDDDKVKFVSARPIIDKAETRFVRIPLSNLYSDLEETILPKNKYDGVELSEAKVIDITDYDVSVSEIKLENLSNESLALLPSAGVLSATDLTSGNYDFDKVTVLSTMGYISYVKVENLYLTGQYSIPYMSENHLEQIKNISEDIVVNGNPRYTIYYSSRLDNCWAWKKSFEDDSFSLDHVNSGFVISSNISTDSGSGNYKMNHTYTVKNTNSGFKDAVSNTSANDESIITVSRDDINKCFLVDYKILASQYIIKLGASDVSTSDTDILMKGTIEQLNAEKIYITVYGDKRVISFENVSASSDNILNSKNSLSIPSGNLLQSKTFLSKNIKISSNIKETILKDYSKGVPDSKFTISCSSYYDESGNIIVDWSKGETLRVEDFIFFDNDFDKDGNQIYRKITGRNFVYDNAPMLDLECIRVYPVQTREPPVSAGLYNPDGEQIADWNDLINTSAISVSDNTITASDPSQINGYLKIPENIKEIGPNAFENCVGLTNFVPDAEICNISKISDSAFKGCTGLTDISIPESVIEISSSAFEGCVNLNLLNFSKNIKYIGSNAFFGCSALTHITLPETLESLGEYALRDCSSLTGTIVLPEKVRYVGVGAFLGTNFSELLVASGNVKYISENGCLIEKTSEGYTRLVTGLNIAGELNIPSTVKEIISKAFMRQKNITSITMPNTNLVVNDSAFKGCTSLTHVYFKQNNEFVGPSVFEGCTSLQFVDLGGVYTIESNAFYGCMALNNVYVMLSISRLENIYEQAFMGCSSLTEFYVPATVYNIFRRAFYDTGLTNLTFENTSNWFLNGDLSYPINVSNPSQNANLITIDGVYNSNTWSRIN